MGLCLAAIGCLALALGASLRASTLSAGLVTLRLCAVGNVFSVARESPSPINNNNNLGWGGGVVRGGLRAGSTRAASTY